MRAVIQRVKKASVSINDEITGSIHQGLLVLLGIEETDNETDIEWLSGKITRLRIFDDANGVMNCSVCEIGGEALVISQFTLHASTKKGNRPSFINAAKPEIATPLYEKFIQQLNADLGKTVATGVFGADMQIAMVADGPVTILIDSKNKV